MSNPLVHFEVVGKDAKALQNFYSDAFGWRMEPSTPTYAMAMPGRDARIDGGVGAAMDGGAGHVTFYIEVGDLDAMLTRIESLGGRTALAPTDVPGGPSIAMFTDPEGHLVGLLEAGTSDPEPH